MKFFEIVSQNKLNYLIENYKKYEEKINKIRRLNNEDIEDKIERYNTLKKYHKTTKNGISLVHYYQKNSRGRFMCYNSNGLQCLTREFKSSICSDYYEDLDIVNAHCVFLSHICKKNKIDCRYLDLYIKNRSIYIKELIKLNPLEDKDTIKKIFLSIINGGEKSLNNLKNKSNFLLDFKIGMKNILEEMKKKFPDKYKKRIKLLKLEVKKGLRKYYKEESFINLMLLDMENDILQCMIKFFNLNKLFTNGIAVLCFDGIMLLKSKKINDKLLLDCEKYIFKNLNISIKLKNKPIIDVLKLPVKSESIESILKILKKSNVSEFSKFKIYKDFIYMKDLKVCTLEIVKEYLNNTVRFITNDTSDIVFIKVMKKNNIKWIETTQEKYLKNLRCYVKWVVLDKNGEKKIKRKTLRSIVYDLIEKYEVPTSDNLIFKPFLHKKDINLDIDIDFNLFEKFEFVDYKKKKENKIKFNWDESIFKKHFYNIVSQKNIKLYNYILKYIAHIIQKPDELPEIALFLTSKQGIGKNTVVKFIEALIGSNNTCNIDNIFNKFNSRQANKLLYVLDEISENSKILKSYNVLKKKITADKMIIEPKNVNNYEIEHRGRYILLSNNRNCVFCSNDDRRYLMIDLGDKVESREYFTNFYKKMKDKDYMKDVFDYFASIDLSKFEIRNIPETKLKSELKKEHSNNVIRFLEDFYQNKEEIRDDFLCNIIKKEDTKNIFDLNYSDFYKTTYKNWCYDVGESSYTKKKFKLDIINFGLKIQTINPKKNNNYIKKFKGIKTSLHEGLQLFRKLRKNKKYEFDII